MEFVNAQEMAREYPDSFFAPKQPELDLIEEGVFVKVCVNDERFWVEVTEVDGDTITGRVDNDLILQPSDSELKFNSVITFAKDNVYSMLS